MNINWLLGEDLWAWGCGDNSPHVRHPFTGACFPTFAMTTAAPVQLRVHTAPLTSCCTCNDACVLWRDAHACSCWAERACALQVWYNRGHCFHACFSDLLLLAGRSAIVICGLIWWLRELQIERAQVLPTGGKC